MARITTTRTVRVALWALRIYLLVLLTLIGVKFIRAFSHQQKANAAGPVAVAGSTNQPDSQAKP